MGRLCDILAAKGPRVLGIPAEATVFEAIEKMVAHNVGSLLVEDGGAVAGIFTERDYLRRVTLQDRAARATRVREVMTSRLICAPADASVKEAMAIMTQERIRHLPVVEEGRMVGVVSIGDLVKHVSREQEVEITYLNEYIRGGDLRP